MLRRKTLYSLYDISVIPSIVSTIRSRSECNILRPGINGGMKLPLITAPMSCIDIDKDKFDEVSVNYIVPRTVDYNTRLKLCKTYFCAFSMTEAVQISEMPKSDVKIYVLIDIANGHMKAQLDLIKNLKKRHGNNIVIMGGNIANPKSYLEFDKAGCDFIRVGIGGGNACLTSTNTSIHYPMASLLDDIRRIRRFRPWCKCKVIADGGISCYSDIIKCLALGADYVMCGKLFAKACIEKEDIGKKFQYYGMSTKKAQKEMGSGKLKTSEGNERELRKEYTLSGWVENFCDYLRSAMSYCNSRTIDKFEKRAKCQVISPNSSYKINNK